MVIGASQSTRIPGAARAMISCGEGLHRLKCPAADCGLGSLPVGYAWAIITDQ